MDIYKNVHFCLFSFEIINVLNIGKGQPQKPQVWGTPSCRHRIFETPLQPDLGKIKLPPNNNTI